MLDTSKAQIFLSTQRGESRAASHRSFHVFNFGGYFNKHRQPFAGLNVFNDETLGAEQSVVYKSENDHHIVIIPLVGACNVRTNSSEDITVDTGQFFSGKLNKGDDIVIINPFRAESINYLYLQLDPSPCSEKMTLMNFDIEQEPGKLHALHFPAPYRGYIGIYAGRKEDALLFQENDKCFFIFVIEGAFEVNNRLLQSRDGLTLWNTNLVEFEALSNNAIILVIELSLK